MVLDAKLLLLFHSLRQTVVLSANVHTTVVLVHREEVTLLPLATIHSELGMHLQDVALLVFLIAKLLSAYVALDATVGFACAVYAYQVNWLAMFLLSSLWFGNFLCSFLV